MRIVETQTGIGRIRVASEEFLEEISAAIETDAKRFVPIDTGLLRSTIYRERLPSTHRVWARAPYAMDVEYGTRPHVIEARPGSALYWPGAEHPVARVNHPGTRAQPYMRPALYRKRGAR